jgi:hypothetical protein
MYVKGLDDRTLTTSGNSLTLGANNRAWVTDSAQDDSSYYAYWHLYLGGTMEFDVDVSQLQSCTEVAGVYLVDLDDADCSWTSKSSAPSTCSTIDLIEANVYGLRTAQQPCTSGGNCADNRAKNTEGTQYGPGAGYTIDSSKSFKVTVKFFGQQAADGNMANLLKIETTLSQGTNTVTLTCDDAGFLTALVEKLNYSMAVVVSNYNAGSPNDVIPQTCPA